jgi:molybdenum-dependent DNA-binding transcriptional regulator ModE
MQNHPEMKERVCRPKTFSKLIYNLSYSGWVRVDNGIIHLTRRLSKDAKVSNDGGSTRRTGKLVPRINLGQLQAFYIAAQQSTLEDAAEALGTSRQSIGIVLKSLERCVGKPLFVRATRARKRELTMDGLTLFNLYKEVIEKIEVMEATFPGVVAQSAPISRVP